MEFTLALLQTEGQGGSSLYSYNCGSKLSLFHVKDFEPKNGLLKLLLVTVPVAVYDVCSLVSGLRKNLPFCRQDVHTVTLAICQPQACRLLRLHSGTGMQRLELEASPSSEPIRLPHAHARDQAVEVCPDTAVSRVVVVLDQASNCLSDFPSCAQGLSSR